MIPPKTGSLVKTLPALLALVLLPWVKIVRSWDLNRLAVLTEEIYFSHRRWNPSPSEVDLGTTGCRAAWFLGHMERSIDSVQSPPSWRTTIRCSPERIPMLHLLMQDERDLARYAVNAQPGSPAAWFWLAETYYSVWGDLRPSPDNSQAREHAIDLFLEGLRRDPRDGLRWRELGDLLLQLDPQAAIKAYLQSCRHGDPGYNGCWLAGRTAERLDDPEAAIRYYRLSRWEGALERADELEAQLNP